ncbi:MAG TPA: glycosyl transferase [Candidatus Magasanikbacteria bacterium]|nr:MAG: glycosyl transferase [Candidatus Magasanikbacteria bacterium RIFOXYC2_FULL_39_8]HAT04103.1 glycosyl transferase [Candidatus Magasanikbacteria bacterium]
MHNNDKISIIIPAYNERETILPILKKIEEVNFGPIQKEIIIVDDFSTDGTREILKKLTSIAYKIIYQEKNNGKGFAIRTALKHVTGNWVIIQDADLEYDPKNYIDILSHAISNKQQVVYGSRQLKRQENRYSCLSFYIGGIFLTKLTNILYGQKLTDEATCYKLFNAELLKNLPLTCTRFEFCPEVTALVAKQGIQIPEVAISYYPRTKENGKKIKWRDGLYAIWILLKYRFKKI